MEQKRKELSEKFKTMCRPAFEYLCRAAGLSEVDIGLLIMYYYDKLSEEFIADSCNMSRSSFQKKKRILLDKLVSYQAFIIMLTGGRNDR